MLVLAVWSLVASAAQAATPPGAWRAEFTGPGGTKGVETLTLVVKGAEVTGTFENAVGGVGPVKDGHWDGKTLRFWVPWDSSDKLEASGTLSGTTLTLGLKTSEWKSTRVFKKQ